MFEGVLNRSVFKLHLEIFCVITTNIWWDILNSYMADELHWQHLFQKRLRLVTLIFFDTIKFPLTLKNTIQTNTIFSFGYQYYTWPCSGPFCWQNPCSGCNSGIYLVVVLENTFFQLVSPTNISLRFTRFRRRYVNRAGVALINHCQSCTTFLLDVYFSK